MRIKRRHINNFFILSVVLHLIMLIAMVNFFRVFHQTYLLGSPRTVTIASYVTENLAKTANPPAHTSVKQAVAVAQHGKVIFEKKRDRRSEKKVSLTHALQKTTTAASHGQQANELLTLLHAAIQKHQQYPPSALEMERQGRTTVTFTLSADGSVQNIHITQSSGTSSLDAAAIAAVREAAPFKGVANYIHNTQEYSIDVIFELT